MSHLTLNALLFFYHFNFHVDHKFFLYPTTNYDSACAGTDTLKGAHNLIISKGLNFFQFEVNSVTPSVSFQVLFLIIITNVQSQKC